MIDVLRCQRLVASAAAGDAGSAAAVLGGLAWGGQAAGADAALLAWTGMPVLQPEGPGIDLWQCGAAPRRGRTGAVRWQTDGRRAFGWLDVPETGAGLEAQARQACLDLFAALRETGCTHLLRVWNYLPRINEDGGGLERYRQFNAGRQRAFVESGRDAFEGAPAACALGTRGGALSIRFLAGTQAPVPVDNPRQVPAYRYSAEFGPSSPTFSRAALAPAGGGQVALFVSGTASIVGEASVHPGDVRAQLRETLLNLQAVLEAACARSGAPFELAALDLTVYLRHAQDLGPVRDLIDTSLGASSRAASQAVYLQADICRAELLVEIEAHGLAPGRLRQ